MKRLIVAMVLVLFLIGLSLVGGHVSWASKLTFDGLSLGEEPDEPDPESEFIGGESIYLSEEPNEPEPESEFIDGKYINLSKNPDEPEPESEFVDGKSVYLCECPDEPESELVDSKSVHLG
jgi:hypothetical protein